MPARKVILESTKKKPSLASLMPDKTKGKAAQTRAVKRIVASASKKTPGKTPKTSKLTDKIVVSTKPVRKRTQKSITQPEPTIVLPSSISIRAKEKSLVLLEAVLHDFHAPAQKIAFVSGLCFVLFGSFMSLAFSGALPDKITPQAAQVSSSTDTQQTTTQNTLTQNTIATPTFTLLEPIPPLIRDVSRHTVSATNAKYLDVFLYAQDTGVKIDLPIEKLVESTYRFTIDGSTLSAGAYVVKAIVTSSTDGSKYSFKAGEFSVEPIQTTLTGTASTTQNNANDSTNDAVSEPVIGTETEARTEEVVAVEEINPVEIKTLSLKTLGTDLAGRTVLKAYGPTDMRFVEFYARPIKSTQLRFLGLGEKRDGYWQYFFNTANVPNGKYEIFAKTRLNNTALQSDSVVVAISNYVAVPAVVDPIEEVTEITFEDTTAQDTDNTRSFSEYSLFDVNSASSSDMESQDIDLILEDYRDELQAVLVRYSVAQQSGDELLIQIAKTELEETKKRLINEVLMDSNLNNFADNIDTSLTSRFEELQKRIETFEELRRVASVKSSSADTDSDGVSDFDEINLYRTNHEIPDTDNDGVNDGVEIMRGYDPLDSTAEAIINYEMPQDTFGLIENELLKIEAVTPFVKTEDPTVAPIVQASIKGKGLPNSYITIYIFSTPTIVTVRTDEDGSFEYTFEKELEDGEHEVYVAVTDNTGAIMARSNPFRFIKEAQAFTPVDAAGSVSPTDQSFKDMRSFDSYNIAIGLGILALGIILLMLGAGLREKDFLKVTSGANDVQAT